MRIRTLYICYFGLREPLVQTQVLPYLRELVQGGIEVGLLTFEPRPRSAWTAEEIRDSTGRLRREGIAWYWLAYHKRPSLPATVYDIAVGGQAATRLVRRHGYDVVHGRALVATAMGAIAKRRTGCRLVFDIRGFNPEEYVDAGVWAPGGLKFRLAKRAEARLLADADAFVVLTERARDILFPGCSDTDQLGRPVEVIPCCVDHDRFAAIDGGSRSQVRAALGLSPQRRVIAYVGALGGFYLTREMAAFLAAAHRREPSTFSLILTQSPPAMIGEILAKLGVAASDYLVRRVEPAEIPRYLRAADLALSFIKPSYSKAASSPTKVAEYLASGLPIVTNAGIGDLDALITRENAGVIVERFDDDDYARAWDAVGVLLDDPATADRCRAAAAAHFDLATTGGERYRALYRRLEAPRREARVEVTCIHD